MYLRLVVLYVCITWATTVEDENRLNICELKVLKNIIFYDLDYNSDTQEWERKSNEHLKQLYGKRSVTQFVKDARLECVELTTVLLRRYW